METAKSIFESDFYKEVNVLADRGQVLTLKLKYPQLRNEKDIVTEMETESREIESKLKQMLEK